MKPVWRVGAALALIAAAGCGGGDDDNTGPTGSITVTASPTSATIPQGGTGTVTVTLARGGGFADPVNVTVEGLPTGVTASVVPTQLTGATTSATVTVTVASTVAAGTYNLTIRASATGVGAATAQYALTVPATPDYTLSATPAAVSIGQGSSGTTAIAINRTNFTDAVALTLVNPPAGITGTFNPASATGNTSTLTINVAGTVATGNVNLTVQGVAGTNTKTTTVAVTVTPPPDYTLSTTPATLTLSAGTNATTTVNINRTNFTGGVTLSLNSPPAGITATFNPAVPTGNTSTATITVAANVAPGNYNVTIQGVAAVPDIEGVAGAIGDPRTTTVALTVTTAASFSISATPNALSLTSGGSGTSTVAIVRTNFTTDVALTLVNPPAGITGTFAPATLTGATLSSTLTLNVAGTVAAGSYPVTVQGAGGALTQTTTVTVTVAAQSVGFTVTPTSLSIQQGGNANTTLNVARTGFTGNITPTVTGNPAGVTVTFNPNPITGTSSTVNVAVGASVTAGTYNVVIAATGVPGNPTVTLPVTVTTGGGGGGNLVWEFCANEVPLKFWRKSNGTWLEILGVAAGNVTRFTFSASGNDAGVAFTSAAGNNTFNTFVMLAISSELAAGARICSTTGATVSKTFNVTGMGGSEVGQLGFGPGGAVLSPATPSYNVNVPTGTYDYLAAFGTSSGFPIPATNFTNYRVGRGQAAPGAAVAIDRNGAPAFATVPFTVTGGAGGSFYQFIESFSGANGSMLSLSIGSPVGTTPSGNMLFLQANDRLATDQVFFGVNNLEQAGSVSSLRSVIQYFGNTQPGSTNFTLPAAVPAFTVTQPSGLWQAVGGIPAEFQTENATATASFQGGSVVYTITATRNWLVSASMATSYTLAMQNLPGFLPAWTPPAPLTSTTVILTGTNITGSGPITGSIIRNASRVQ